MRACPARPRHHRRASAATGTAALRELAREFDRVELDVARGAARGCAAALAALDPELRAGAGARGPQHRQRSRGSAAPGAPRWRRSRASSSAGGRIRSPRVGVYAPGGRAAYPSSVLMGVVPAQVAGVGEVIVCSPPGPGGLPAAGVLAAAALAGADRVFALGGAGAVAAHGLRHRSRAARRPHRRPGQRLRRRGEAPGRRRASPSTRRPGRASCSSSPMPRPPIRRRRARAARPGRARPEPAASRWRWRHDAGTARAAARRARARSRPRQPRRRSSPPRSRAAAPCSVVDSLDEAWSPSPNAFAPEHLLLAIATARRARQAACATPARCSSARQLRAFGDYMTGANHVLPPPVWRARTRGLSMLDFVRWTTCQRVSPCGAARLAADVGLLADARGCPPTRPRRRAWRTAVSPAPASLRCWAPAAVRAGPDAPCGVDLSDNTNLWGMPAGRRARAARGSPWPRTVTRYPRSDRARAQAPRSPATPACARLEVITGCGSDDVIDSRAPRLRRAGRDGRVLGLRPSR